MSIIGDRIKKQVINIIEREDVELVECKISNSRGKIIVKCLVDYPEGGITLDKCGLVNREIVSQLEGIFPDLDYLVTVNSPGLDRPLKREKDFKRVKGKTILLWFREPVLDKLFIEAKLEAVGQGQIYLDYQGKKISLEIDKIKIGKQKFR